MLTLKVNLLREETTA